MVLATCGIQVSETKLCGLPSAFLYEGIVRPKRNESMAEAIEKRGQVKVFECLDHARRTFLDMEPALKDGEARMRCVVQVRITIRCDSCNSLYRFEPVPPTMHKMPGKFCPNCGNATVRSIDPELDYWELVAASLDDQELPIPLVRKIYTMWMQDPSAKAKFVAYVNEVLAEV